MMHKQAEWTPDTTYPPEVVEAAARRNQENYWHATGVPLPEPPDRGWTGNARRPDEVLNIQHLKPEPYRLYGYHDLLNLPAPSWQVVGVIPDQSFTLLFGPTGTLKSFVALDIALCVAAGEAWHGHRVIQGPVLYIAAEGGSGIAKRTAAWLTRHEDADIARFATLPHKVNLADPSSLRRLDATIDQYCQAHGGESPALIVVDTWSRNTPGVNENSSEDQSKLIAELVDGVCKTYACGVIVVHHSGLDKGRERGSTALPSAADARWETKRDKGSDRLTLRCHKLKEWAESPDIKLKADVVNVDVEHFGNEWDPTPTSLVLVDPAAQPADPHVEHKRVADLLRKHGRPVATRDLHGVLEIRASEARARAEEAAACPQCDVETWQHGKARLYAHTDQQAL